jgi:hypothetical protein
MKKWLRTINSRMKERLEKFADKNREYHGGRRLDCCTVNKKPTVKIKSKKLGQL